MEQLYCMLIIPMVWIIKIQYNYMLIIPTGGIFNETIILYVNNTNGIGMYKSLKQIYAKHIIS